MKISSNQVESILRLYTDKTQGSGKKRKSVVGEEKQDTVAFSSHVEEVRELYARYRELPEVREELVKSIQERLSKGEYQIDGEEVARKMVQREMVDFLVNRSGFD
ncbi:MAG: flagellar biosynthesis anti-sigma factor FlgM [Atribacterota bacterium]|nr:flagellar biosynthesis anti-sigma factor FlgM [Atribacterota bacterium]